MEQNTLYCMLEIHHSKPMSFKDSGLHEVKEVIEKSVLQHEMFWIWKLKAMDCSGLNDEIDLYTLL